MIYGSEIYMVCGTLVRKEMVNSPRFFVFLYLKKSPKNIDHAWYTIVWYSATLLKKKRWLLFL